MNSIFRLTLFVFISLLSTNIYSQQINCKIKGTIIDRTCNEIYLLPATDDFSTLATPASNVIKIKVINNHFEYDIASDFIQAYYILFRNEIENQVGLVRTLFTDSTAIEVEIHPDNSRQKTTIKGGVLNQTLTIPNQFRCEYDKKLEALRTSNKYYIPEYKKLKDKYRNTADIDIRTRLKKELLEFRKRNNIYTPEAINIRAQLDSVSKVKTKWIEDYIQQSDNILAYYWLYNKIDAFKNKEQITYATHERIVHFQKRYPQHPITKTISKKINALFRIYVGEKYIDFTLPTLEGKEIKVSEIIKNKIAIINLWSSFCGPCRAKGKKLIPIYEKYKDKGFTVIGAAREYKTTSNYQLALKQDNYPWINTIDFNNEHGIWRKYGIENTAGIEILVNSKGIILAINPSPQQIEEILEKELN
ncbi:AhpC/TSA family protein [Prolixibacteraceae bacterium JC049]|nr:AhpC/TSA family protein [Prolixibacteraceae bacterium JC049]